MPRTIQIPPKNSSDGNILVERVINTAKHEDTEVPHVKKAKNSSELPASTKMTVAVAEETTKASPAKKKTEATGVKKIKSAAGKKNKAAATKKTKASATKKPEKPEKMKNPKLCVPLCLPGNGVLKFYNFC